MALSASSNISIPQIDAPLFLYRDNEVAQAPREWEPATLLLPWLDPAGWMDISADLQGRSLPVRLERVNAVAQVSISWPRVGAGSWQLRVHVGKESFAHLVRVKPAKLSDDALETLVRDLEERLPASVVIGLDRLGAFAGLSWQPPARATLAQELEQVRIALDGADGVTGFVAVLHEVARHPHYILKHRGEWAATERARRPLMGRLPEALLRAGTLGGGWLPTRVVDQRVETSFDIYENRLLGEFFAQTDRRLRSLEKIAIRLPSLAKSHGHLLTRLRNGLRAARQAAAFLDQVGSLRASPDRLTQVMLRRAGYRAGLEGFIRFRRSARVRLAHPALDLPTEDVPALYEAWGTLIVLNELLGAAEGWEIVEQCLFRPGVAEAVVSVMAGGTVLRLRCGGATAALHIQQGFYRSGSDLHSISFEQRPDLVLEVRSGAGNRTLHLFDPKYKLDRGEADTDDPESEFDGTPQKVDIDKMHAYRDAIRDSSGQRVVGTAAILYPGPDQVFGDGIAAISAYPGSEPDKLREWIGAQLTAAVLDAKQKIT